MASNPTIGMVSCPLCGELAAVRKDKRGHFYYISAAGRIAPSADFGQEWFLDNATIWGSNPPPDDCPDWIAQGKSFPPTTHSRLAGVKRETNSTPPRAVDEATPAPAIEPVPAEPEPAAKPGNPFSIFGDD